MAPKLISYYLVIRRTRANNSYSSWEDNLFEVPQESILERSLFNIFLSASFLVIDDIDCARYVDDNLMYCGGDNIDYVILSLQHSPKNVFFDKVKPNGVKQAKKNKKLANVIYF